MTKSLPSYLLILSNHTGSEQARLKVLEEELGASRNQVMRLEAKIVALEHSLSKAKECDPLLIAQLPPPRLTHPRQRGSTDGAHEGAAAYARCTPHDARGVESRAVSLLQRPPRQEPHRRARLAHRGAAAHNIARQRCVTLPYCAPQS